MPSLMPLCWTDRTGIAWSAAALLVIVGLSACVDLVPSNDYPTEYPTAPMTGTCPDLSGTFENSGTLLKVCTPIDRTHCKSAGNQASAPQPPTLLSNWLLAPAAVPSGAQVTSVRIRGPAQGQLQIEALTPDGTVAQSSIPIELNADGFVHSKPFSKFLCYVHENRSNVYITNEPPTAAKSSGDEFAVRLYRATDGSLVVARERITTSMGMVDVLRGWYLFRQVRATAPPVVQ